jgi:hypothetical protein
MADPLSVTLHALGAEASAGSGDAVDIGELRSALTLELVVSVTPGQVLVVLETSPDGLGGWREVEKFSAAKSATRESRSFDRCDRFMRVSWNAAATFGVVGEAHVLYATREDVLGAELPLKGVQECKMSAWAQCLIAASGDSEDAVATSNPMPLTKWPASLRSKTARIAAWNLIRARGIDANSTADMTVKDAHDDAQKWLLRVSRGELKPPGLSPLDNLGIRTVIGGTEVASSTVGDDCGPRQFTRRWGDFG